MKRIAALGDSEFTLGFMLSGIKDVINVGDNPLDDINEVMANKEIGIVIIDERVMDSLDSHHRHEIENNVTPVFISLSTKVEQDSLRKLIKKSIGVDLWK